jgi:hypothetical protein
MDFMKAINDMNGNSIVLKHNIDMLKCRENNLKGFYREDYVSDGARFKCWVRDKNNTKFLYKENKIHPTGEYTKENYSEYISMLIARQINVPCVDIILKDNAILSRVMSNDSLESFIEYSEEFSHSFHMSNLSTFNISTLLNKEYNIFYREVITMLLFDALIGNSDRHPGNFMHTQKQFYPLFDNGSSLCAYVKESDIHDILKDRLRFEAMCTTKSKPVVRDSQKLTHEQLVGIIRRNYTNVYTLFKNSLHSLNINEVLDKVDLSTDRKELLRQFLSYRLRWFI